jgi:hypothetical protein
LIDGDCTFSTNEAGGIRQRPRKSSSAADLQQAAPAPVLIFAARDYSFTVPHAQGKRAVMQVLP